MFRLALVCSAIASMAACGGGAPQCDSQEVIDLYVGGFGARMADAVGLAMPPPKTAVQVVTELKADDGGRYCRIIMKLGGSRWEGSPPVIGTYFVEAGTHGPLIQHLD